MSNETIPPTRWYVSVVVPWATEVVSMNARSHWTNTHRQIHALRERGRVTARAAFPDMPHFGRAACIVYVRFPDKRRRDLQNYHKTLKALLDGFVDAGLLPDDDADHLVGLDVRTYYAGDDVIIDKFMRLNLTTPSLCLVFAFEGTELT